MFSSALKLSFLGLAAGVKHHSEVSAHAGSNATAMGMSMLQDPPCQCVPFDKSWKKTTRTVPKCIFIDLGAADGNTFDEFIADDYGPVENCPSGGKWEAFLVEANPIFSHKLKALEDNLPNQVHSFADTAAYSCQGQTSFFIDVDKTHNFWGSSMSESAPDAVRSGKRKVTVPTVNVNQMVYENTIPGDYVILKIDIESAEYDVVPCLAQFNQANLVDRMELEEHTWFPSVTPQMKQNMALAKQKLTQMGVAIPAYFSNTL
eukprot:TRINITY_DN42990_c0_g1_i1.p1 TRINITY_DN42990_c0_g1~~TRINITY_DN42990_c0_g1_i1.p1  ORF type:complete len:261 (+),score=73.92 TRINITY_DN42990_c0_g1_i1:82-864(+)